VEYNIWNMKRRRKDMLYDREEKRNLILQLRQTTREKLAAFAKGGRG